MKKLIKNQISIKSNIIINIIFAAFAIICILPIILTLSISLSKESLIAINGFSIFPQGFNFEAYRFIFSDSSAVIHAYIVTISVTIIGTFLTVLITGLFAYPLSRSNFKYRKGFTIFIFITMMFNGGLVPWYIVNSQLLHITNSYLSLILPALFNVWYIIIMRTFYSTTIHPSLIEAAKIDGAGEFHIFFKIVSPLSKPAYATIALFSTLFYWNDWWHSMVLNTDSKYDTLQYFIYKVLTEANILRNMQSQIGGYAQEMLKNMPAETAKFAMAAVAMGPILIVYPFFQKYFIKGLTIGSVKG